MKRIVIKEDEWGPAWLLSPRTGKKCCLGFLCLADGYTEDEIQGKKMPIDVDDAYYGIKTPFGVIERRWMGDAAQYNDAYHRSRSEKKRAEYLKELRRLFRENGYQFVLKRAE